MGEFKLDRELFRKAASEFTGTAMLMLIGSTACLTPFPIGPFVSMAWGIALTAVVHVFAFLGGAHVNPAVSACATILGHMDWKLMLIYFLLQFLGALLGYGLAVGVAPKDTPPFCVTVGHPLLYDNWKIIFVEFLVTSVLLLSLCAIWDKRSNAAYDSVSVRIGFILAGLIGASFQTTGGSLNFFRTLAPGLIYLEFEAIWAYLIAHILAAVLVPLLWRFVFTEKDGGEGEPIEKEK